MLTLFILFVGLLAFVIFLLAIPIDVEYRLNNQRRAKSQTHIIWLYGLIDVDLEKQKDASDVKLKKVKISRKPKKPKKQAGSSNGLKVFLAIIRSDGFTKRLLKLIRDILLVAEIRKLKAHLAFGMEDPADTGQLLGLMSPMFAFIYAFPRINFVVTPVFDRPRFEADIKASIRIVPIRFFRAMLSFIFSVESFRALRSAIQANKT